MRYRCVIGVVVLFLVAAALPLPAKELVTIWMSGWVGTADIIHEFNDLQSKIEVIVEPIGVGGGDPNGKLVTSVAGGAPPNLILAWDDDIISFATAGLIQPLTEFFALAGLRRDDYVKAAWEQVHYRGRPWGAPVDWDPDSVLYVNKRLFAESGVGLDSVPQYLDEMEAMHRRLSRQESDGRYSQIGIKLLDGWQFNDLYLIKAHGGQVWDPNRELPDFENPRNLVAMNWIADWSHKYRTMEADVGGFGNQDVVMMIGGDWMLNYFVKTISPDDINISRAPYPRDGIPFFPGSGWSWMVPTGARSLDATYEVLAFLMQPTISRRLCNVIGWVPASIEARRSREMQAHPMGIFARIAAIEGDFIWMNPNPIMSRLGNLLTNEVTSQVYHRNALPAQALANAQRMAMALYQEHLDKVQSLK